MKKKKLNRTESKEKEKNEKKENVLQEKITERTKETV